MTPKQKDEMTHEHKIKKGSMFGDTYYQCGCGMYFHKGAWVAQERLRYERWLRFLWIAILQGSIR